MCAKKPNAIFVKILLSECISLFKAIRSLRDNFWETSAKACLKQAEKGPSQHPAESS